MTTDEPIMLGLSSQGQSHCVILCPPGGSPARDVLDTLHEHGVEPVVVNDPLLAMAEIALFSHLRAKRTGWGLQPDGPIVLLIERADDCPELDVLRAAIDQYFQGVPLSLNGSAVAPPRPAQSLVVPPAEPAPPLMEPRAVHPLRSSPELRLVESGDDHRAPPLPPLRDPEADESEPCADTGEPLVTRDELAMLLDDSIETDTTPQSREEEPWE